MKKRRIYVASSWRNEFQPQVVSLLRYLGHEVYDFRKPNEEDNGFSWSDVDPNWQQWSTEEYVAALDHPVARKGFFNDKCAMDWADTCVLVLPSGRSAHTEAGVMKGEGKEVIVFTPLKQEPELMYKLFDGIIVWVYLY